MVLPRSPRELAWLEREVAKLQAKLQLQDEAAQLVRKRMLAATKNAQQHAAAHAREGEERKCEAERLQWQLGQAHAATKAAVTVRPHPCARHEYSSFLCFKTLVWREVPLIRAI